MHSALQIPEVVHMICFQLYPDHGQKLPEDAAGDLAALARTSKFFQDVALDALWSFQDTFAHILRCMPSDVWGHEVVSGSVHRLRLRRPISLADWERPLLYMNRVKTLSCESLGAVPDAQVFDTLTLCLPTEHFFPNIAELVWSIPSITCFSFIRRLLGPRITSIDIDFPFLPSVVDLNRSFPNPHLHFSLIPTLPLICPRLEEATLVFDRSREVSSDTHHQLREDISQFVKGLKSIHSLHVAYLNQIALEHLASLTTLTSLTMEHLPDLKCFPSPSDSRIFPHLSSIEVWTSSVRDAIAFTQSLSHSPLVWLGVTITENARLEDLSLLYSTVAKTHNPTLLETVQIGAGIGIEPIIGLPAEVMLESAVLTPFLHFHNLDDLWLDTPFDLDDEIVLDMARAWPQIRVINFFYATTTRIPPRTTLYSLGSFAQHCPKLQSLTILLDGTKIPPEADSDHLIAQNCLTQLIIGYSPIRAPSQVARFISGIFPGTTSVRFTHYEGAPHTTLYDQRWRDVQNFITKGTDGRGRGGLFSASFGDTFLIAL
ncbi:hypothetical protein DFH06DRAFT_100588 [Mycena polygramma]|nr:hypothetical protein DFH06DRAFT_100588 [Mycena polygramma]